MEKGDNGSSWVHTECPVYPVQNHGTSEQRNGVKSTIEGLITDIINSIIHLLGIHLSGMKASGCSKNSGNLKYLKRGKLSMNSADVQIPMGRGPKQTVTDIRTN